MAKPNVKLLFPKKFDDSSDDDAAVSSQQASAASGTQAASASPASVGDCYRATKAPREHKHRTATEHSLAGSRMLDAEIVLQKDPETDPRAARIKTHHNRAPDVGIGILISIPCYRAGREAPEFGDCVTGILKNSDWSHTMGRSTELCRVMLTT